MNKNGKGTQMKLKNITPKNMSCGLGACPAIFKNEQGNYLLIGRKVDQTGINADVLNRVGKGEVLIEVPKALLAEFIKEPMKSIKK